MTIDITDYGAVPGGRICTREIQAAIEACDRGDVVYIPEGEFTIGAIFLKSDVIIEFAEGARLIGSTNLSDYPILKYGWEGQKQNCYASLINTCEGHQRNITIRGKGVIDANGQELFQKEMETDKAKRGRCVCLRNVDGVTITGVTLRQSPAWCLHLLYCRDVHIQNVEIHTKYNEKNQVYQDIYNGDGIDIDACKHVLIEDSLIASQDDCIAIKSGRDAEGRQVGIASEDVEIRNCTFKYGFGVAIGSEMSGGVRHVLVHECQFQDTYGFASIKAPRGRGGVVEDIIYRNISHYNHRREYQDCKWFRGTLNIDQFYGEEDFDWQKEQEIDEGTPVIRNILFEEIRSETIAGRGLYLCGLPEQHLQNITFQKVRIKGLGEAVVRNADNFTIDGKKQKV